jgi:DNA-3-methyladenine glycosylase I
MPNAQPKRCSRVNVDQVLMREYHDREWGVPAHEDRTHFEFLILEAAQAGLSWSIVLKKRVGYSRAFSDFNPEKVARYSEARIVQLTADPRIIRNRAKIAAAVKNARAFLAVREEYGSFDAYCWQFVDGQPRQNRWKTMRQIPATTRESDAFSRDLKRRRFQLRRIHRDRRPHAGGRNGQRPSIGLFPIPGRSAARHQQRMKATRR